MITVVVFSLNMLMYQRLMVMRDKSKISSIRVLGSITQLLSDAQLQQVTSLLASRHRDRRKQSCM